MKELVTTIVFLVQGEQILLAMKKRGHGAGHWNGPGGKLESGETAEQAMVRECSEEIDVTPLDYAKAAEHTFYELHGGAQSKLTAHVFLCTKWNGEPTESEEMKPQWFAISDIPYDTMWPDDIHWLPQVLAGKKIRAEFHYDDENQLQSSTIDTVEHL
jgi:mutator protein MutT